MSTPTKQSSADASPAELSATFDAIDDASGMYSVEHFPDSVRSQLVRDFKRHHAGEDPEELILLSDGTEPEAVNAVLEIVVAERIAKERGIEYEVASAWQRRLRNIRAAVRGEGGEQ